MKIFILFILLISSSAFSQSEKMKWGKADYSYQSNQSQTKRDYSIDSSSPLNVIVKSVVNAYWFFISDVDGDNCPFYPSCSSFFVDAVSETNILQGTLMFFDRFTRDASFVGRYDRYPKHISGKLYDPSFLYHSSSENYIPASKVIDAK